MGTNIETLLTMYKATRINDYVFEREMSQYFGDYVNVKLVNGAGGGKSFCFFALPVKLTEGLRINLLIDKNAIKTLYSDEQFVLASKNFGADIQNILRRYNSFRNETMTNELSPNEILGFLLNLYSFYRKDLSVGSDEFLPDSVSLLKYSDLFSLGKGSDEDIEKIVIDGMICREVISYCKENAHLAPEGGIKITISDENEKEIPMYNYGFNELMKNCTGTFGIRSHKELPHDYKPETNQ